MGDFDTDSPAAVVIYDAGTPKVPRDGRLGQGQSEPVMRVIARP